MTVATSDFSTGSLLERVAATLDLPEHLQREADCQYHLVGEFLSDHPATGNWDIYPQGSMLLGTVVAPVSAAGYDLDMVCRVDVAKESITQAKLKERVGDALADYVEAHRSEPGAPTDCAPSRRAWNLHYPDEFHMDVLPAVPDAEAGGTAILLTDKELREWQRSNPIAYCDWFRDRMNIEFEMARKALAARLAKSVEAVPDWQVRTTLQRVVQLLKRHRDLYFADDLDDRPPSILITTLAARAYQGHSDLTEAVVATAERMADYIEVDDQGRRVVMSPVAEENFADKWNDYPVRAAKFAQWAHRVVADLSGAADQRGIDRVAASLDTSFGSDVVTKAARALGVDARRLREAGGLSVAGAAAGLTSAVTGRQVKAHGFYGGDHQR